MELERKVVYALQTSLDRALDLYKSNMHRHSALREDPKRWVQFIASERNKIKTVATIQRGLEKYRSNVTKMDVEDRESERHDSKRLGDHMRAEGLGRPGMHWQAHAIVCGSDTRAWLLRSLLAECEVGIDDAHNGCWLPSRTKYAGQQPYPNAVPHSRIHRHNYFAWLNMRFVGVRAKLALTALLRQTRMNLLHASFPPEVMLPKGKWNEPHDNLSPNK